MESHQKLLLENKAWAQEIKKNNPNFFKNLAKAQSPEFLWIGCSDSRVSGDEITGAAPGEMFVHRNIANLVVKDDVNLLSVVQYAIEALEVSDIIICGHYGCGGIKAAMDTIDKPLPLAQLNRWLEDVRSIYRDHQKDLKSIDNSSKQLERLVELNVQQQVQNLANTSMLKDRWYKKKTPVLRGWVYALETGLIKEIITLGADQKE